MIIDIVTDREILTTPCMRYITPKLKATIVDMLDTAHYHSSNCLGLSSNQVGSFEPVFLIRDLSTPPEDPKYDVIIQPRVISVSGGMKGKWENCLSFPDNKKGILKRRHKIIAIEYLTGVWKEQRIILDKRIKKFKGMPARVVQHELDHLRGVLI